MEQNKMNEYFPLYPSFYDPSFYMDIYRKREFNELKGLDVTDPYYFPHQKIIARYISNWTLYQNLLLVHDTGTGKSASAAAVYDGLAAFRPDLKTLYLVNNDSTLENFKNEVVMRSKRLSNQFQDYLKKKKEYDPERMDMLRSKFLKEKRFEFYTYGRFSRMLETEMEALLKQWSYQLLILDETHHLILQDLEKKKPVKKTLLIADKEYQPNYKKIKMFLHSLPHKKCLFMTATPMRNSPIEISPLLNLILPIDKQLPTDDKFVQTFLTEKNKVGNVSIYEWQSSKAQYEFQNLIKGYVSVVRQQEDVRSRYIGYIYPPMQYYPLFMTQMSSFQSDIYFKALQLDTKKINEGGSSISFYSNSIQVSLMVFPDGSYGIKNTKKYFTNKNLLHSSFFTEGGFRLGKKNIEDVRFNLEQIKRFSGTYFSILEQILENPLQLFYIYCDKINGSGIWACVLLLKQLFGYELLTSSSKHTIDWNQPRRRCIFLNDVSEDPTRRRDLLDLIQIFNDERNKNGNFIQVIFGTDRTREGITLKRIQQIHIVSPDWNFGKIFQAIGRGIRLKSHEGLPPSTKVAVYLHCIVPDQTKEMNLFHLEEISKDIISEEEEEEEEDVGSSVQQEEEDISEEEMIEKELLKQISAQQKGPKKIKVSEQQLVSSIQFYKYFRSEIRDRNIKLIEYSMLISAFDCQLNKSRNTKNSTFDDQPKCYYEKCDYPCIGIDNTEPIIDESTYDLYYIQEIRPSIIRSIINQFYYKKIATFDEIFSDEVLKSYTRRQIFDALQFIVQIPMSIPHHDGRDLFLYHNTTDATYFLIDSPSILSIQPKQNSFLVPYFTFPSFEIKRSLQNIQDMMFYSKYQFSKIMKEWLILCQSEPEKANSLFEIMPLEIQLTLLQTLVENNQKDLLSSIKKISITEKGYIFDKKFIVTPTSIIPIQSTTLQSQTTVVIKGVDHNDPAFLETFVVQNTYPCYGYLDDKGQLKLRDVRNKKAILEKDLKKRTRGQNCRYYSIGELIYYLFSFEVKPDETSDAWKEIKDLNPPELKRRLSATKYWLQLLDLFPTKTQRQEFAASLTNQKYFLYFISFTNAKSVYCNMLLRSLQEKNLLAPPPL